MIIVNSLFHLYKLNVYIYRLQRHNTQGDTKSIYTNKMTRYIQIAALLPSKCVRDVALRVVREENIPQVAPQTGSMTIDLPPGISVVDARQHEWINSTLNANVVLINTLRDNLVQQRAHQNMPLYNDFRRQAKLVQDFLTSLPIQLPEPNFAVSTLFLEGKGKGKSKSKGKAASSSSSSSSSTSSSKSSSSSNPASSSSSSAAAPSVPAVPAVPAPAPVSKRPSRAAKSKAQ